MANDLVVNLAQGSMVLAGMTVEELRSELAATLTMTARHLVHLADVWQELQRRGEDLSQLRSGLWSYMPMLASGMLDAELVVRYAGSPVLLKHLAQLPRYEQDIILNDDTVVLIEREGDTFVERRLPVQQLKGHEIARVLRHKIVPKDEQRRHLLANAKAVGSKSHVHVQSKSVAAAKERRTLALPVAAPHTVVIKLSEDEWEALKARAKQERLPVASLIIGTLTATGLLTMPKRRKAPTT